MDAGNPQESLQERWSQVRASSGDATLASDLELLRRWANEIPYYRFLGMTVESVVPGRVQISVPVKDEITNGIGLAHGGVTAALIDSVVGIAAISLLRGQERTVTLELKINYLAPAPRGTVLTATGEIIHRGRTTAVGQAQVHASDGKLVAVGLVTYAIL